MEKNGPKIGPNGDKRGHIGQNLFKDGDCPRDGDYLYFFISLYEISQLSILVCFSVRLATHYITDCGQIIED